jgi:hypothetical protein
MNQIEAEHSDAQKDKVFLLSRFNPQFDPEKLSAYLGGVTSDQVTKLKFGGFGTIIFDLVFDTSVIPEDEEKDYESAFNSYFRGIYGPAQVKPQIVLPGKIFRPEESRFYDNSEQGPNSPRFLREWVANLRAVFLMLQHLRTTANNLEKIKSSLVKISIWKIFDESGELHEDLLHLLPITDQNRLLEAMEIVKELKNWQPGPRPGAATLDDFFAPIKITDPVLKVIEEDRAALASQLEKEVLAEREKMLHLPSQQLPRHILLPDILRTEKQLATWIDLILGLQQGKLPSLIRSN